MGITYIHPKIHLKNRPFFSIIFLFIFNFNDFVIGWLLFKRINFVCILTGIYFGILGSVGQIVHEVKDFEADRIAGINTNAVRFGQKRLFFLGSFLYTISIIFFIFISIMFYRSKYYLFHIITYPFYLYSLFNVIKNKFDRKNLHIFVTQTRIIYFIIGIGIFLMKMINMFHVKHI